MGKQYCLDNWKTQDCMMKLLFAASSEHIKTWTRHPISTKWYHTLCPSQFLWDVSRE